MIKKNVFVKYYKNSHHPVMVYLSTPSQADIEMTRSLMEICQPFEIVVHDHLVIGRENTASFKTLGLM